MAVGTFLVAIVSPFITSNYTSIIINGVRLFDFQRINVYLFWGGIVLTLISQIANFFYAPTIQNLEREVRILEGKLESHERDYFQQIDFIIQALFEKWGLTSSERITLFTLTGDFFLVSGRHSSNPVLSKVTERMIPLGEGIVGRTWESGTTIRKRLPDPRTRLNEYEAHQRDQCGLGSKQVSDLSMKSRCYFGFRIMSHSNGGEPVAVLIIESVNALARDVDQQRIERDLSERDERLICSILEPAKKFQPNLNIAAEKGF